MIKYMPGVEGEFSGYVAMEPEQHYKLDGAMVASVKVCLNGKVVKQNGEAVNDEQGRPVKSKVWVKLSFYEELAVAVIEAVKKNSFLVVPGYMQITGWIGEDGNQRNDLEWVYQPERGQLRVKRNGVLVPVVVGQPST